MTSSKSINYSKYSIIKVQNINLSNSLDLIEKNNEKEEKPLNELSQILMPNSQNITNNNNNYIDTKELQKTKNELDQTTQISVHNLLYGNPIDSIKPKYLGKSYSFFYDFDGNPKITIGPDCK